MPSLEPKRWKTLPLLTPGGGADVGDGGGLVAEAREGGERHLEDRLLGVRLIGWSTALEQCSSHPAGLA